MEYFPREANEEQNDGRPRKALLQTTSVLTGGWCPYGVYRASKSLKINRTPSNSLEEIFPRKNKWLDDLPNTVADLRKTPKSLLKTRKATRLNPPPLFNSIIYNHAGFLRWPHGVRRVQRTPCRLRRRYRGNALGRAARWPGAKRPRFTWVPPVQNRQSDHRCLGNSLRFFNRVSTIGTDTVPYRERRDRVGTEWNPDLDLETHRQLVR